LSSTLLPAERCGADPTSWRQNDRKRRFSSRSPVKAFRHAVTALAIAAAATPALAQSSCPSAEPSVRLAIPLSTPPEGAPAQVRRSSAAGDDASALAEKLQNPIGGLTSVPFQSNTNFSEGPNKGTQDVLNIQPVIPVHLNEDWNLITRTILPLVWNPSLQPGQSVPFGLAPTAFSALFSPRQPVNGWISGAGPIAQIPTVTSKTLGSNVWGAGPALVVVRMDGPRVYGLLVNNVFSSGGTSGSGGTSCNVTTINPFLSYNFGGGWFIGTGPIITASWNTGGEKWTLPVGAQAGWLIKIGGELPVNPLIGAYYNALRPQFGAAWQLRTRSRSSSEGA
jgi:hypothetical protein